METTRTLTLGDGRLLAWEEAGDPDGAPILFCHGSPGSRLQRRVFMNDLSGVRMITPDRPGCGRSDYQPGRRIGDWVEDATALVEHLGLSELGVLGFSGGTPYAIAAAASDLPIRALGIVSGDAPPACLSDVPTGLGDVAERWPRSISLLLRLSGFMARYAPDLSANRATSSLSPPDQVVVAEPRIRHAFLAMLRDA
ncbi:MAG: alpha/beta fold hydrolase, partial [Acidimicrobiia bacterium]